MRDSSTSRLALGALLIAVSGVTPVASGAQPVAQAGFLANGSFALPRSGAGSVAEPGAIAWAPSGDVHVADARGGVVVFDAGGAFLRRYGTGELRRPAALAVDSGNLAFVLDTDARTVLVFDASGVVRYRVSGPGQDPGRLDRPVDLALGPDGLLYILDRGQKAVQIFSRDGTFVHDVVLPAGVRNPRALGVGVDGVIFVADRDAPGTVLTLPPLTETLGVVDAPPPGSGRLSLPAAGIKDPVAVVVTPTGLLAVGDGDSGVLWSADAAGEGRPGEGGRLYGGKGSGRGSFEELVDLALAGSRDLLLLDRKGGKVERIRLVGEADRAGLAVMDYPVRVQSVAADFGGAVLATAPTGRGSSWVALSGPEGRGLRVVEAESAPSKGVFGRAIRVPRPLGGGTRYDFGARVERAGDVALNDTLLVVTEPRRNRFFVFDLRSGELVGSFGDNYEDERRLRDPEGVALFPDGRIAIADKGNHRVAVFSADVATLLGTFPMRKVRGVSVSPDGRLFAWDEPGESAGEQPLDGTPFVPLPAAVSAGGVGALTFDVTGNLYVLRRGSARVAVLDRTFQRLLARVGGQVDLERGDHLSVDRQGDIFATDLRKGRGRAFRWGVDVPALERVAVTWTPGGATLRWSPLTGSFIAGYRVEGAATADGPWAEVADVKSATFEVADGTYSYYRVRPLTLTGAGGEASPDCPVLHLSAAAAFEAEHWRDAARQAREAMALARSGKVTATPEVTRSLAWQGLVASSELGDARAVLGWQEQLGGEILSGHAFEQTSRLADAHRALGDTRKALDRARDALRVARLSRPAPAARRVEEMKRLVFETAVETGSWNDVASVGEDLLRSAPTEAGPDFLQTLARAHYETGDIARSVELVDIALGDPSVSGNARRRLSILGLQCAAAGEDYQKAVAYADAVGDSVPVSLFGTFQVTLARVRLATGDPASARAELLYLLDGGDASETLRSPTFAETVLGVYRSILEGDDAAGGQMFLDTLAILMPDEARDVWQGIAAQATVVAEVADTRAKLGEGFTYFHDALFRDALRFFQDALKRDDLTADQKLISREIQAWAFYSLGRVEDADNVYRGVFEVDRNFDLDAHMAHVEDTYGLSIFTEDLLAHFRALGPIL